jgi:hypothetical protein
VSDSRPDEPPDGSYTEAFNRPFENRLLQDATFSEFVLDGVDQLAFNAAETLQDWAEQSIPVDMSDHSPLPGSSVLNSLVLDSSNDGSQNGHSDVLMSNDTEAGLVCFGMVSQPCESSQNTYIFSYSTL